MDTQIRAVEGTPQRIKNSIGEWFWTVPLGYKTPSCPSCGHKYWDMQPVPEDSVNEVPVCKWCAAEHHVHD